MNRKCVWWLTLKELVLLELLLDVFKLSGLSDIDAWLGLSQLADVDVSILLVPLPLEQLATHGYRAIHLYTQNLLSHQHLFFTFSLL